MERKHLDSNRVTRGQIAPTDGYNISPEEAYEINQATPSHNEIIINTSQLYPDTPPPNNSSKRKPPIAG